MARPRKSATDTRARWDALYVTPGERAEIKAAAEAAGLSVSRYLVARHHGAAVHTTAHRRNVVVALAQAEAGLAEVSAIMAARSGSVASVETATALLALERTFRAAALQRSAARACCAEEPAE